MKSMLAIDDAALHICYYERVAILHILWQIVWIGFPLIETQKGTPRKDTASSWHRDRLNMYGYCTDKGAADNHAELIIWEGHGPLEFPSLL